MADMVPTTEFDRGTLAFDGGNVSYFGKSYDAVVLLVPDGISKAAFAALDGYAEAGGTLVTVGDVRYHAQGERAEGIAAMRAMAHLSFDASADAVSDLLEKAGIRRNRSECHTLMEDGSLVFTADGVKSVGNPLVLDGVYEGHHVRFEGEDFLALRFGEETQAAYGAATVLEVDGASLL